MTRKYHKAKKIVLITLGLLLGLQIFLALAATPIARGILASSLAPETSLKRLYINLFGGTITIRELTIAQPEGYGDEPFVSLGRAYLNLRLTSLLTGKINIDALSLDDLSVTMINNTQAVLNATQLTGPATPPVDESEEEPVSEEVAEPAAKPTGPVIRLAKGRVQGLSFTYLDLSKSEKKPVSVNLRQGALSLDDIVYNPAASPETTAKELISRAELTGQFEHADTPPSYLGLVARLGELGPGIPAVVAELVISGIELGSVGSMIPPGVAATLGGDVVDLDAKVRLAHDLLDVRAILETAGAKFPLSIGGTPDKPEVNSGEALLGAFGRVGNLVGNTAGNAAAAGMAVGEGAVNVASSVGKGALDIAGGVGKGLFKTVKGVATLDVKEAGGGLVDSVSSVGKSAANTVVDASSAAVNTVGDTAKAGVGGNRDDEWSGNKRERHDKLWPEAQARVNEAAYPTPGATENQDGNDIKNGAEPPASDGDKPTAADT
jgi:hypothetical protein